jgi:hypothetical protein
MAFFGERRMFKSSGTIVPMQSGRKWLHGIFLGTGGGIESDVSFGFDSSRW